MFPARKNEQYVKKFFLLVYFNLSSPNPSVLVWKLKYTFFLLLLQTHPAIGLLKIWRNSSGTNEIQFSFE